MTDAWRRPLAHAFACVVAFLLLLAAAYWIPFVNWADGWAVQGFLNLQRPWLNDAAHFVARLADPLPFAVLTVAIALVALRRGMPRHALAVIVLLGGSSVITQTLKVVLTHERSHDFLGKAQLGASSYPSGHATASMSIALAVVLVAPLAWRPLVAALGGLYALGVSESIMLLAWHFPSDVAGGYLVASGTALATVAALRAAQARWPERSGREAARRAFVQLEPARIAAVAAAFASAVLVGVLAAAGDRALAYADDHTLAVAAAVVVAVLAAALPAVAARSAAPRP